MSRSRSGTPGFSRIRCTSGTTDRKAAQEYHDRLKAQQWRQDRLGERAERTVDEAALGLLKLSEGQRDFAAKKRHVAYWRNALGRDTPLSSLTAGGIHAKLPTHTTHKHRKPKPLAPAAKNRYLATIRRILNPALEWEWIDRVPKLKAFEEPDVRVRWEPPAIISKLIQAISRDWLKEVALFAVSTGMRADEILSLVWSQVDHVRRTAWVTHSGAKSKRARAVPLNDDAVAVLRRRLGKHDTLVFTRQAAKGREVAKISQIDARMFARACKEAKVADFHFHDLRHTWASWHVQRETPLMVLKELGGWERIEMVQKYAHLATSHLAAHANNVKFWSNGIAQKETPPERVAISA